MPSALAAASSLLTPQSDRAAPSSSRRPAHHVRPCQSTRHELSLPPLLGKVEARIVTARRRSTKVRPKDNMDRPLPPSPLLAWNCCLLLCVLPPKQVIGRLQGHLHSQALGGRWQVAAGLRGPRNQQHSPLLFAPGFWPRAEGFSAPVRLCSERGTSVMMDDGGLSFPHKAGK